MGEIIVKSQTAPATPAATYGSIYEDSADKLLKFKNESGSIFMLSSMLPISGRLTLESGSAVSTTDQVDKTTLYWTPNNGNFLALYENSLWVPYTFTELSLDISGYTASKPYDIFVYNNAGALTLYGLVWTNGTTRATALLNQNGRYVLTGDTGKLYLGTIFMDAASKCQLQFGMTAAAGGSTPKCYVYNEYNKVPMRFMSVDSTASWAYTGGVRAKNAGHASAGLNNSLKFVNGNLLKVDILRLARSEQVTAQTGPYVGVCVDNTNAIGDGIYFNAGSINVADTYTGSLYLYSYQSALGYHYLQETEVGATGVVFIGSVNNGCLYTLEA